MSPINPATLPGHMARLTTIREQAERLQHELHALMPMLDAALRDARDLWMAGEKAKHAERRLPDPHHITLGYPSEEAGERVMAHVIAQTLGGPTDEAALFINELSNEAQRQKRKTKT